MAAFGRRNDAALGELPVAELWQRALSGAFHGAGCSCGAAPLVLTSAGLEEDLMDFLAARYPHNQAPALANALASRDAARHTAFPTWLDALQTTLDPADWARLDRDVRTVLNSAAGAGRGFACT